MSIDVADWLRGLGLGQYAQVFADNDIDGEVLPELTADDLTGLGINSIGHRRKLLAAMADRGDAEADQIIGGQLGQYLAIDVIVVKGLGVLRETEPAQPIGDIDGHCLPR